MTDPAARNDETGTPSAGDVAMLRAIAGENVTWRSDMAGRKSFRLWSTERDYTTCTPAVKRLLDQSWAKTFHGYMHGRGGVDLTTLGVAVLTAHIARSPE